MVNFETIPKELQEECRFCVWKFENRADTTKPTKVPYNPATGARARTNDTNTFADFETARKVYNQGGYDGIGIQITGNIGAFDIDRCIGEDGTLNDIAIWTLYIFAGTYVEISPSGIGLRGFFKVDPEFKLDKSLYYINNRKYGLELYLPGSTNRFVTVTGNVYREEEILDDMDPVYTILNTAMVRKYAMTESTIEARSYLSDEEVLTLGAQAKNGERFRDYINGDWDKHFNNQSDADMSFLSMLCFWCGCDKEQIDRIFRTTGMMRDKWDEYRGHQTYGDLSINKAVRFCKTTYLPQYLRANEDNIRAVDIPDSSCYIPSCVINHKDLNELLPESNPRYDKDEIGMGNIFADYFRDIARFNGDRQVWYIYNGTVWQSDTGSLKVSELAKFLADELYSYGQKITDDKLRKGFLNHISKLHKRKNRETMIKDARSVYPVPFKQFDNNKYLFNCANGTLDLKTMEFREHQAKDFITKASPVEYNPDAVCKRWITFIDEVMEDDKEKSRYLQKALGYSLTGDTSLECLFILYGPTTRNGKGTTMGTFLQIMGDYGKNTDPNMLASRFNNTRGGGPSEDIARLAGARFVNISEPDKKIALDAALAKRLTGNDTITARYLNENSFEYTPEFKIFINTNHLPNISDATLFESGRIKIIPFHRHFDEKEQDNSLKSFFSQPENLSGIFNWVLDGYRLFIEEKLEMPESVWNATEEYHLDSDRFSQFFADCINEAPGHELKSMDIYNKYREWSQDNGYFHIESIKSFKPALEKKFTIKKKRPANHPSESPTNMVLDVEFIR